MTSQTGKQLHRFPSALVEVEVRHGYIHVVATGTLSTVSEVDAYHAVMEKIIHRTGIRMAIVDVRGQSGEPPPEVRSRAWTWLSSGRGFERLAYVVPDHAELKATRINMTGLSTGVSIRTFKSVMDAHRWLSSRPSQLLGAVRDDHGPGDDDDPSGSR